MGQSLSREWAMSVSNFYCYRLPHVENFTSWPSDTGKKRERFSVTGSLVSQRVKKSRYFNLLPALLYKCSSIPIREISHHFLPLWHWDIWRGWGPMSMGFALPMSVLLISIWSDSEIFQNSGDVDFWNIWVDLLLTCISPAFWFCILIDLYGEKNSSDMNKSLTTLVLNLTNGFTNSNENLIEVVAKVVKL